MHVVSGTDPRELSGKSDNEPIWDEEQLPPGPTIDESEYTYDPVGHTMWKPYCDIIRSAWDQEASNRPTAAEILVKLEALMRDVGAAKVIETEVIPDLSKYIQMGKFQQKNYSAITRLLTFGRDTLRNQAQADLEEHAQKLLQPVADDPAYTALDEAAEPWLVVSRTSPPIVIRYIYMYVYVLAPKRMLF
jgi:hypothetical protein